MRSSNPKRNERGEQDKLGRSLSNIVLSRRKPKECTGEKRMGIQQ